MCPRRHAPSPLLASQPHCPPAYRTTAAHSLPHPDAIFLNIESTSYLDDADSRADRSMFCIVLTKVLLVSD